MRIYYIITYHQDSKSLRVWNGQTLVALHVALGGRSFWFILSPIFELFVLLRRLFSISGSLEWLGIPSHSVQSNLISMFGPRFSHRTDAKCCFPGSSFGLPTTGSISPVHLLEHERICTTRPAHAFADACQPLIEWIDTPGRGDVLMFVVHCCGKLCPWLKNGKHSRQGSKSNFSRQSTGFLRAKEHFSAPQIP